MPLPLAFRPLIVKNRFRYHIHNLFEKNPQFSYQLATEVHLVATLHIFLLILSPLPPMCILPSHPDRYMYIFVHFAHLPAHRGDVWFELGALGPGRQQPVARAVRLIRHAGQVRFPRWHHHLHLNLKVHQRQIFLPHILRSSRFRISFISIFPKLRPMFEE